MSGFDRRQARRAVISGAVTVTAQSGPGKGIENRGILRDMSDGGVCVLLESECGLTRGTEVILGFFEAPPLRAWVCHNRRAGETTWSFGMSFAPVEDQSAQHDTARGTAGFQRSEQTIGDGVAASGPNDRYYLHHLLVDSNLSLRIWQEADAAEAFDVVRDSRSELEQWVEWAPQVRSADNLREFIRYSLEQHARGKTWQFAIRQREKIAGGVGLVVRSGGVGEIGYWLGCPWQGQGIATRCAQEVIRFGFAELGLSSMEIRCAVSNDRSRAVAERLGFLSETIIPSGHWTGRGMDDLVIYRSNSSPTSSSARDAGINTHPTR